MTCGSPVGLTCFESPVTLAAGAPPAAAFLLDGDGGRDREAFVRYLQAVYAGHDSASTLAELTGSSYSELDAAYRRFIESLP